MRIRILGDPCLVTKCEEVENFDSELVDLAAQMIVIMKRAPGVGLAAPQIGINKRLFVYDANDETGPHAVVNPVLSRMRDPKPFEEGCLSVPGFYFDISRYRKVRLEGRTIDGKPLRIDTGGLRARIFQHEVDHLNETLIVHKLNRVQKNKFESDFLQSALYSENGEKFSRGN